MIFVPTAANVEEDISGWLDEDINNFKKLGFKSFEVIDISKTPGDEFMPTFERADVIVFGGGNEKYLLERIREAELEKFIKEFAENHVYVGISAGSMIAAEELSLKDSGQLYYEDFDHGEEMRGLGFVDFEIRPHLNSDYFKSVRQGVLEEFHKGKNRKVYTIDDQSAIKVVDSEISVVSEGEWKKFD